MKLYSRPARGCRIFYEFLISCHFPTRFSGKAINNLNSEFSCKNCGNANGCIFPKIFTFSKKIAVSLRQIESKIEAQVKNWFSLIISLIKITKGFSTNCVKSRPRGKSNKTKPVPVEKLQRA